MNKLRIIFSGFLALALMILITLFVIILIYAYEIKWIVIVITLFCYLLNAYTAYYVFKSERQTNVKMCWIFSLCIFPIISVVAFVIFGIRPFHIKQSAAKDSRFLYFSMYEDKETSKNIDIPNKSIEQVFKYNFSQGLYNVSKNNEISIIKDANELFLKSIEIIRSAKKTIHIQYYILRDGVWLRTIATELLKKKKQGVNIKFMYDWAGCYTFFPKKIIAQLKKANIEVLIFNPKGINKYKSATNFRSHRKGIIVDNKIALYGGSNLADEYLSINPRYNFWNDKNYIVKGAVVNSLNLQYAFDICEYSSFNSPRNIEKKKKFLNKLPKILIPVPVENNNTYAQYVCTSPDYHEKNLEQTIISIIRSAKKNVRIITPYLFPSESILNSITTVSLSGVNVEIIVPNKGDDKRFVISSNKKHYAKLMSANVCMYEYLGFIHSKMIIIDDEVVFTGNSNLDYRSLWINFESSLLIYDKNFTSKLIDDFNDDIKHSIKITQDELNTYLNLETKFRTQMIDFIHPLI